LVVVEAAVVKVVLVVVVVKVVKVVAVVAVVVVVVVLVVSLVFVVMVVVAAAAAAVVAAAVVAAVVVAFRRREQGGPSCPCPLACWPPALVGALTANQVHDALSFLHPHLPSELPIGGRPHATPARSCRFHPASIMIPDVMAEHLQVR
jgi:hypothetical protein